MSSAHTPVAAPVLLTFYCKATLVEGRAWILFFSMTPVSVEARLMHFVLRDRQADERTGKRNERVM